VTPAVSGSGLLCRWRAISVHPQIDDPGVRKSETSPTHEAGLSHSYSRDRSCIRNVHLATASVIRVFERQPIGARTHQ